MALSIASSAVRLALSMQAPGKVMVYHAVVRVDFQRLVAGVHHSRKVSQFMPAGRELQVSIYLEGLQFNGLFQRLNRFLILGLIHQHLGKVAVTHTELRI